jgi:hypothetical protein
VGDVVEFEYENTAWKGVISNGKLYTTAVWFKRPNNSVAYRLDVTSKKVRIIKKIDSIPLPDDTDCQSFVTTYLSKPTFTGKPYAVPEHVQKLIDEKADKVLSGYFTWKYHVDWQKASGSRMSHQEKVRWKPEGKDHSTVTDEEQKAMDW